MKCCHCGAPKAAYRWTLRACADGRKPRSRWLCAEHDIELNERVLTFLGDKDAAAKVRAYRAKVAEDAP